MPGLITVDEEVPVAITLKKSKNCIIHTCNVVDSYAVRLDNESSLAVKNYKQVMNLENKFEYTIDLALIVGISSEKPNFSDYKKPFVELLSHYVKDYEPSISEHIFQNSHIKS